MVKRSDIFQRVIDGIEFSVTIFLNYFLRGEAPNRVPKGLVTKKIVQGNGCSIEVTDSMVR